MDKAGLFGVFRALRHRNFALIWVGQTASSIGDFAYQIVIAWWVLEHTRSAVVMGQVLIATFLPVALASLVGGVVVDRLPRVPIMLVSDALRAAAVLTMAVLAAADQVELWMIYALGILFGISDAFFAPAYFALLPLLLPRDDLPSGNALTGMSFQLGRVAGPALGSLLIATSGATGGLFVNGLSFLIPALLVLPVVGREPRVAPAPSALPSTADPVAAPALSDGDVAASPGRASWLVGWFGDIRAGWATVWRHPVLSAGLLLGPIIAALLVGPFLVAMPFLVAQRFGDEPRVLGLLLAIFPVGFILGGLWGGRLARLHHRGWVLFGGMAVAALMLAVFGLRSPLGLMALAALINGFALELANLSQMSAMQELVPEEQLGRVVSLNRLTDWIATPVAFGVAGWATEVAGPETVFLLGAGAAAGLALMPLSHPRIYRFD
jgi:MFS family permease